MQSPEPSAATTVLACGSRAACVELGLDCYAFPPRYDEHGKAAPHVRNDQMLAQADLVVAFWDGKSRGTKSVIDKAEKLGIPVEVVRG